jgi:hypothetical protein
VLSRAARAAVRAAGFALLGVLLGLAAAAVYAVASDVLR